MNNKSKTYVAFFSSQISIEKRKEFIRNRATAFYLYIRIALYRTTIVHSHNNETNTKFNESKRFQHKRIERESGGHIFFSF